MAGLINLGAGLSAAGGAVAQFGNDAGVLALKTQLENQSMQLASNLAEQRQHQQNIETGVPIDVATKNLNLQMLKSRFGLFNAAFGNDEDNSGGNNEPAPAVQSQTTSATTPSITTPDSQTSPAASTPASNALSTSSQPSGAPHSAGALSDMAKAVGMPTNQFAAMWLSNPNKAAELVVDHYKLQVTREGGTGIQGTSGGGVQQVYANTPKVEPLPSDPDARQTLGIEPGDKGYLQNGKPVIAHKDNPNSPFNEDGTPNTKFQQWELDKARETAKASTEGRASAASSIDQNDPAVQADMKNILSGNMTMQQVPMARRGAVSEALAGQPSGAYSPVAQSRMATAAARIRKEFLDSPGYERVRDGLPLLARMDAAMQHPGSVSDQDLLDSLTKMNTQGQITDAQAKIITDGKSLSDWAAITGQRLQNGGVLSQNQRQQAYDLAHEVFQNYKKQYGPLMDQLTDNLQQAGIPKAFWGVPDLNAMYKATEVTGGNGQKQAAPLAPMRPNNVPNGSAYSPSRKMWRTPDGKMFDESGKPVQ